MIRTYLEITDPAAIRPPRRALSADIRRVAPADGAINRAFYEAVGRDCAWTDHLGRDAAWWQAHAEQVETWVLMGDAGYYELTPDGDGVQIAHFGLVPAYRGRGLGGLLLEHALRRGFELGARVWLHTSSQDGPHALANYRARGLVPFRVER